jgi:hypothetical protein
MSKEISRRRFLVAGASVLAVGAAALVGGTYAKYKVENGSTASAQVAKFGVTIEADSTAAATFSDKYKAGNDSHLVDGGKETGVSYEYTVKASASGTNVLAPGTNGILAALKITGTPEVAVAVDYAATVTLTGWTANNSDYCPIVFKVDENTSIVASSYTTLDGFTAAVAKAIEDKSTKYPAGTDLSKETTNGASLGWEWPFENSAPTAAEDPSFDEEGGEEESSTTLPAQSDDLDTALGGATTPPEISLTLTATVTQID